MIAYRGDAAAPRAKLFVLDAVAKKDELTPAERLELHQRKSGAILGRLRRRPDAGSPDAGSPDAGAPDAGGVQVFDVEIFVANACNVSTVPASITVPAGTAFTVNWINQPGSASNVDIDKIDPFNQVPLIIGLEPDNAWHDTVRQWCGPLFMGTFSFRITGCFDPYFLDVDCAG